MMMTGFHMFILLFATADVTYGDLKFRVVDLTHPLDAETLYWPDNPDYNFTVLFRGQNTQNGYWYETNYFGTGEHGGTHVDAPAHFYKGRWRAQQIPIERLMGPGVVINVKAKAEADSDYRVTVADLEAWEAKYGTRIPNGAIVLMNSGWTSKYPVKTLTFGSNTPTDPATFHFPGFHEEAADWLAKYRNVHVVGVDTPSVDYGQSKTFPVHVIFGRENIIGAENVANLDKIPEHGTMVYVGLVKLFDGSGGPARVFATYYEKTGDETSSAQSPYSFLHGCYGFLIIVFYLALKILD